MVVTDSASPPPRRQCEGEQEQKTTNENRTRHSAWGHSRQSPECTHVTGPHGHSSLGRATRHLLKRAGRTFTGGLSTVCAEKQVCEAAASCFATMSRIKLPHEDSMDLERLADLSCLL